jgi:hypothetical protein
MGVLRDFFKNKVIKVEPIAYSQSESDIDLDACTFEIVGESFQRDHLVALLKKYGALRDGSFPIPAKLELEPTNDFDPTAVKVMVEGMQVGYIPKHLSGDVTKALRDQGVKEYTVDAVLGWDSDSPMPLIGVKLDMSEFGL